MVLLVGGLAPGRHIVAPQDTHPGRVLSSAMHAAGCADDKLGEVSGKFADVFALRGPGQRQRLTRAARADHSSCGGLESCERAAAGALPAVFASRSRVFDRGSGCSICVASQGGARAESADEAGAGFLRRTLGSRAAKVPLISGDGGGKGTT
jgi:hypothetical protein